MMTLLESLWAQWLNDLSTEEQIEFHRRAAEKLTTRYPRVPIDKINRAEQPIDGKKVEALKYQLRTDAFTPLIVRRDESGNIELVSGFHMLAALEELGYTEAPVQFEE